MNKACCFLVLFSFLNLTIYPAFADEYMVLPPVMEEQSSQNYNNQNYNNQNYNTGYDTSNSYSTSSQPLQGTITTVPVGTAFQIITDADLNSARNQIGEIFTATLNQPIAVNGDVVIPAGSEIVGQITYLQDAGRAGKNAKMEIKFTSIKPLYGAKVPIMGKVLTQDNTGILKGGTIKDQLVKSAKTEAIVTAGGTVVGAGIGAALGGVTAGTGAAVGAASSAGIGLVYLLWRKGQEVKVPSGTKIIVMLEQPFSVGK